MNFGAVHIWSRAGPVNRDGSFKVAPYSCLSMGLV